MKRIALFVSLLLLVGVPAAAQNDLQTATLTAAGTGVIFAAPDIMIVDIGVTNRGERLAEALDANSTDMQAVIDSVLAAGVDAADIVTSGFSIGPIYSTRRPDDNNEPLRIIGYSVSNEVTVRIGDPAAAGDILDQVVAAGANQVNGIRFEIADPEPLWDQALQAAIIDARRVAELMAEAADVRLVRVLSVSTFANAQPQFELSMVRAAVPIVGGEQGISATATIVFEIAPR